MKTTFNLRQKCHRFGSTSQYAGICVVLMLGLVGACRSPAKYKMSADTEVYQILEEKWQDDFGQMANYKIQDTSPNNVDIEKLLPPNRVLTLADAVRIATKISREYQSQKESLYLSALGLTDTRHDYAWQWLGTVDATYTSTGSTEDTSVAASVGPERTILLPSGIQISAGLAVDWVRYLSGDTRTTLGSVLSSTITAPILGAGAGKAAFENLTQAELNVLYRIRSFNRYRRTFVTSVIDDYYGVLQQRDRVTITEASYKSQLNAINQLRLEVEVGQRPQADADEVEQQVLSLRNSLISAQQNYAQTLDRFKIRLALPTDASIVMDQNELSALETIGVSQPDYTEEEAIVIALERRLDLANTRDNLIDAERKLILAAEGLGPQIDLEASSFTESTPETDYTRLRFHEGTYSLSLVGDLGLDQKSQRNAYRRALITVQQQQRGYDEEVENIKLAIRQAYRDLAETAESYEIQRLGVELALRRLEEQKIRLQYGSGTVRQLLESENALLSARNDQTDALVRHTITKLNFFRDIGVLQVKPDGMWEQVSP